MKNFKIVLASLILFQFWLPQTANSQSRADLAFSKLKTILGQKVSCNLKTYEAYLNKSEAVIDISDSQIPIREVKVYYFYNHELPSCPHFVKFDCEEGNCIVQNSKRLSAVGFPMRTKNICYDFINIFSDLKKAL